MPDDLAANPVAADAGVKRRRNALLWWGFILSLVALGSYVRDFSSSEMRRPRSSRGWPSMPSGRCGT